MKLILMLFFVGSLNCFAQLSSSPMEKLEIIDGNILNIVPNAQSMSYSYLKKKLGEPLSGSEVFKKFDEIVLVGEGEEVSIFENHSSFSIKSAEKANEFLLTCSYNTLSFKGGISFQQAIVKKNKSGGTIVELIKDVQLTAGDALKWEKSGLSLEDFIGSGKYTSMPEKSDETSADKKGLPVTPKIELPSGSKPDRQSKESPAVTPVQKYNSPKFLWPWVGIGLLVLSIVSLFVYRRSHRP